MDRNCRELVRGGRSHFFALCRGGRSHFGGFWIRSLLGSNQYCSLLVMLNTTKLDFFCRNLWDLWQSNLCNANFIFSNTTESLLQWGRHLLSTLGPALLCHRLLELSYLCLCYPLNQIPGYGHGTKITHFNLNHSLRYSTVWIGLSVGNTCWHNPRYHWEQCILLQGTIQAP